MSGNRSPGPRLRPLRTAVFGASVTLTMLAAGALAGLLPPPQAAADTMRPLASAAQAPPTEEAGWPPVRSLVDVSRDLGRLASDQDRLQSDPLPVDPRPSRPDRTAPAQSGHGRRVVLDLSAQQVWLVREGGSVHDTYRVSGSVYDNLAPGRYSVYSKSRHATSFDYAATMRWMVRFTQGAQAAIGFHDIPKDRSGQPVQTWSELGSPQSHGCIRQKPADARALWRFAPIGTPVAVVA